MEPSTWAYDGWIPLIRTAAVGAAGYLALIAMLRVSGKRTVSQMNVFDLVVTVAMGSILASMLGTTSLARGVAGFAVLIGLQTLLAWASSRWSTIRGVVSSSPTLLLYRGAVLEEAMRRERVTRADIEAAVRAAGRGRLEEVDAVVLAADGSLSVIDRGGTAPMTALNGVDRARRGPARAHREARMVALA